MSYCPECNSRNTVKIVYGREIPEVVEEEKEGRIKYGGMFSGKNSPDRFCKDCKHEFNVWELTDNFTNEELDQYYIKYRSKYKPDKVKYLIINEAPPTIYDNCVPPFFYNNPNCLQNSVFLEIMTTLFLPEEFIEKTRTVGHTVDLEVEMHKYLKMFKEKGFFEIDILDFPVSFLETRNITPSKLEKKVIIEMQKTLKSKLLQINKVADKDTIIIFVKKTTYNLLYSELSTKYRIANDCLVEEYGKPYLPGASGGHQKVFRQKFRKCLESFDYQFETDFSYLRKV